MTKSANSSGINFNPSNIAQLMILSVTKFSS